MTWTIAFDSGCDLRNPVSTETAKLVLVPLKILLGDRQVIDDGTTSLSQLQGLLDETSGKTGTACPSVGDWQAAMEQGDRVLAITISGGVSGSYQSACIARDLVLEEHPEKEIRVMDSRSGSGGMELLVRRAADLIDKGCSFEEVCQGLEDCRAEAEIFFLLQNVSNVVSNGRLNPIIGRAVQALHLSLLATVSPEGKLDVIGKVRGFEKAMDRCIEECGKRNCSPREVLITHCQNPAGAQLLREKLLSAFPHARVEIRETGPLCGYYAEKGGLIAALQR